MQCGGGTIVPHQPIKMNLQEEPPTIKNTLYSIRLISLCSTWLSESIVKRWLTLQLSSIFRYKKVRASLVAARGHLTVKSS